MKRTWICELAKLFGVVAIILACKDRASASPGPPPLNSYVGYVGSRAEFVIKGRVRSVTRPTAGDFVALVGVDSVLKGDLRQTCIEVTYPDGGPRGPRGDQLVPGEYVLLFLNKGHDTLVPFDSQQSKLPICEGRNRLTTDPRDVLGLIREELLFTGERHSDPMAVEAVRQLGSLPPETRTVNTLKGLLQTKDMKLRGAAIQAMLDLKEPAAVGPAVDYVEHAARADDQQAQAFAIIFAMQFITSPEAIETFAALITHKDARLRRSALYALSQIADGKCLPTLVRGLDDEDQEVRYRAVMGLSNITLKHQWGPGYSVFKTDEKKYIALWKQWWETEGKPQFQQSSSGAAAAK